MSETTRACADCGVDIGHRHGNAKRCEPCAQAMQAAVTGQGTRTRPCAIDDGECVPGRLKGGLCERHYRRKRLTGQTHVDRVDHFSRYEVTPSGCWRWTGPLFDNGYGHISAATAGVTLAHRAFYMRAKGEVPEGLDLDHLCRNRACVNPDHLEPVSRSINIQRGVEARDTGRCKHGHDMSVPDAWIDTGRGRRCRECWRMSYRAAGQRYRAKKAG